MKHPLTLLALAPLFTGCVFAAAAAAGGFVVSQQVLPNNVHVAQVALDVDKVWPSVKETVSYYQEPGSEPTVTDVPRTVHAKVDGAKVTVEVEAIDLDRTTIRVTAERMSGLTKDNETAAEVMNGILEHLEKEGA